MRLLLAAINAPKGALDANLEAHVAMLEQARSQGCDIAVFPEFSLTGSVDPARHPERAVTVDSAPVRALVAATQRVGVAAVFGIAERAGSAFHITQVYAHDGRLGRSLSSEASTGRVVGWYRKRHLGEGEEGYLPGSDGGVFAFGAVRFGVVICAEGGVDFPWAEAASGGASVVFFCSAPGLHGRRTDEAGWRAGHDWWVECGLGDAVRHARRWGLWVALATQAGAVENEDFPGLAALVTPDGQVAARLPDWRPGTLTVELPLDAAVQPVREAVRALVVDAAGRALLVRFTDDETGASWWSPPGGGMEPGEDRLTAVRRELREELGRDGLDIGPWIGRRTHTFWWGGSGWPGGWMTQRERWVACRTEPFELNPEHVALLRSENIREMRWWSAQELRSSGETTTPRGLAQLLDDLGNGRFPDPDTDLGV